MLAVERGVDHEGRSRFVRSIMSVWLRRKIRSQRVEADVIVDLIRIFIWLPSGV